MLFFVGTYRILIIPSDAWKSWQSIIALNSINLRIGKKHLLDQGQHKSLNFWVESVHPLKIIFRNEFTIMVNCFPVRILRENNSSSWIVVGSCKTILKPGNNFDRVLMGLSNEYFQRIKEKFGIDF